LAGFIPYPLYFILSSPAVFVLVPGGTSTFREFPKRRNDEFRLCQTGLFWIRNSELATDFARQQIGNLCVAWYRGNPARVGQIYILTVLPSFLGKNTIKSLQVPD
jgi:hypothetical protein